MALFQISEPDSPALERVMGIDLGTTHSLVAVIHQGVPHVLPDAQGNILLHSVVGIPVEGDVLVGEDALAFPQKSPKTPYGLYSSFKRWIGRAHRSTTDPEYVEAHSKGYLAVATPAGIKTACDLSAYVLYQLKLRAEAYWGDTAQGAVITVPAYFDEAQRQSTKEAAELAGLRVLRLLNEPTAAAIAYGLDEQLEGIYAVYDLGGGTFDLSLLKLSAGVFEVLATAGNIALGGDDFDRALAELILSERSDVVISPEILRQVRRIKEQLSSQEEVNGTLYDDDIALPFKVTAAAFQSATQLLLEQTLTNVRRALRDARLSVEQIKGVVLVGGATRMPHVRTTVARFFKQEPLTNLDPDQIVAIGAARQAMQLAQSEQDWLLLDVTPLSLGLETMGGLVEKLIPRNTTLPVSRSQEFTTFQDGQTALKLHIVQGEREAVKDCRSLAHFSLNGLPPLPAGLARIRVTFQMDADGLLSVVAREMTHGIEASVTVKPSEGLEGEDIQARLNDAMLHAREDMQLRRLEEAKVEAARVLKAVEQAWIADHGLLNKEEQGQLKKSMLLLQEVFQHEDVVVDVLVDLTKQLDEASFVLATRRMDKAIASQLEGVAVKHLPS